MILILSSQLSLELTLGLKLRQSLEHVLEHIRVSMVTSALSCAMTTSVGKWPHLSFSCALSSGWGCCNFIVRQKATSKIIAYEQIPAKCTWLATIAMLKVDISIENAESQSSPSQMCFVVTQIKDRYILIERSSLHRNWYLLTATAI